MLYLRGGELLGARVMTIGTRIRRWKERSTIKDGHWIYPPNSTNGGAQVGFKGKSEFIHRISAHLFLGYDLKDKRQINHKTTCPHRTCWNPECLYIGTQAQNMADKWRARWPNQF